MWAKQSTAATLIVGPCLDSTGAEYAGLIITDLSLSKNGGTLTALASAATLTLIANGQYTLVLTTGNLDTLGRAQITCNKSTYQMPSIELMVLPSTVFDALVTNAVNAMGGLVGATAAITAVAGYIGATGAAVNGSNINTLSGHDPGATLGTSTLTQTQVTGGAYAINNASFAFNTGLDFTTTQKAATLARVTLNDTTTTNTDMRGTDNAALAATALSTAQWTNTLATNIGTTNTTVATNLDATVSSRLASASYTTPPTAAVNASAVRTELTAELADIVSMDGRLPAALVSGFMSSALGDTDHGGSAATLSLSTIEIEPDSANTPGVFIRGTGSGAAVDVKGGENADGIKARSGDTSGYGICSNGVEGGARFWSTNGYGVRVSSDNSNAFSVYGGVYAFQINSLNNAIDIYSTSSSVLQPND